MNFLRETWIFLGNNVAEIIALCALFFTAYQILVTRRHNMLSVKPHLTTFVNRDRKPNTGTLSVVFMNNGLGPARIKSYQVILDKKPIRPNNSVETESIIKSILGSRSYTYRFTTLGTDYVMPANESKDILSVQFSISSSDDFEEIERQLDRFDLVVEYESMYGQPDSYDSRDMNQRVEVVEN